MSESLNKTSQKDQNTTDETVDSWADLENTKPAKEGPIAPSKDEATVEDLAFLFEDVDEDDKVENYTQQE